MMAEERIQKVLARAGIGSRRQVETWIRAGRIAVNGRVAEIGEAITTKDKVELDGKRLRIAGGSIKPRVIALNKPVGVVCAKKVERGEKSIFKLLPRIERSRWVSVGRLDINTGGLILFTNHGELANRLMHPRYQLDREYAVRVYGQVSDVALQAMRNGIEIDGEHYQLADVVLGEDHDTPGSNKWYYCVVRQGRNREVRKIWESQGVQVSRLNRVRFGNVVLPRRLRVGKYQEIEGIMLKDLYNLVGMKIPASIE
ncbi:MAG: pseudouridine synthase [Pseudomonadota bacterium]